MDLLLYFRIELPQQQTTTLGVSSGVLAQWAHAHGQTALHEIVHELLELGSQHETGSSIICIGTELVDLLLQLRNQFVVL